MFSLALGEGFYLYRLQYLQLDSAVVLICEITDDESGGGVVFRLNADSADVDWALHVPAFNISDGLVDSGHLYISGIGFVCNIDLSTGRYLWDHSGLYDNRKYSFNAFLRPVLDSGFVVFEEILQPGVGYSKPRKIRVNASTGELHVE